MKYLVALFLLLVSFLFAKASILPADRSVLNFTQVMFQFDEQPGADTYVLTIITNDIGDNQKVSYTRKSLACLVTEGLQFGRSYQWHYEAFKAGVSVHTSPNYSFSISSSILVDSLHYRYKILQHGNEKEFQDNLLLMDNHGVMINRKAEPVWFMPNDSAENQVIPFRNLSMTKDGHFIYLKDEDCFEKDIYGNLTWKGPDNGIISGDSTEHYHHDFSKMDDGTYLVCGYRFEETPNYYDPAIKVKIRYNTLIQYDKKGKVIWSWNEKDHFSKAEMFSRSTAQDIGVGGTHMNGFDYNKKANTLVLSCRDNSSLALIDKKNGRLLNFYKGNVQSKKDSPDDAVHFYQQHAPTFLEDESVLFYNNNVRSEKAGKAGNSEKPRELIYPVIMNVSFRADMKTPKTIWEYECRFPDEFPAGLQSKGGYVITLPNTNMLVCLGGANKIFEVTRSKKIVWEMNAEKYNRQNGKWIGVNNYRCHYTSSLYPSFFTVQNPSGKNNISAGQSFELKINNDGTDDDEYKITFKGNDQLNSFSTIVKIPAQSSITRNITLTRKKAGKDQKINIIITAVSNPLQAKTVTYSLQ